MTVLDVEHCKFADAAFTSVQRNVGIVDILSLLTLWDVIMITSKGRQKVEASDTCLLSDSRLTWLSTYAHVVKAVKITSFPSYCLHGCANWNTV